MCPHVLSAMTASDSIVVTGIGAITPVGNSAIESFEAVVEGRGGVGPLSFPLHEKAVVRIGAEVKQFDGAKVMGLRRARQHARVTQMMLAAAREASADAGLPEAGYEPNRVGVILGIGLGGAEVTYDSAVALHNRGPLGVSPYYLPALIPNMPVAVVSMDLNAMGPSFCVCTACASSGHAMGQAFELLRSGRADAVVTGGGEAGLTPIALALFDRMRALSRQNAEPASASRPFDRDRDGFVMGEGCGALILEREDAARRRGARIYARLLGYGSSSDAFSETLPRKDGEGAAECMRTALRSARLAPEDVDYINAHGTGTPANDPAETRAIRQAFNSHADALWVSSTKGATGHLLGGAAAVEAVFSVLSLQRGVVPPTLNLSTPDAQCDLDYVPREARQKKLRTVISNTFGFGGHNATVVFGALH